MTDRQIEEHLTVGRKPAGTEIQRTMVLGKICVNKMAL